VDSTDRVDSVEEGAAAEDPDGGRTIVDELATGWEHHAAEYIRPVESAISEIRAAAGRLVENADH
jgi:hypothetical protein